MSAPRCRCIKFDPAMPCCRERVNQGLGAEIDRVVRSAGYFTLTNLEGTRLHFFPRTLPMHLQAFIARDNNQVLLRNFLITQARVGPQHAGSGPGRKPR